MTRRGCTLRILFMIMLVTTVPAAFISGSQIALGAEGGDNVYTLDESIQYALEHNWAVKEKTERVVESEFAEREAKADFLPMFSTTYSYTRLDDVSDVTIPGFGTIETGDVDNFQWKASVTQPIFTGFALTSAHELAKLGIDQSNAALALEKLDLVLRIKEAYFSVLKADRAVAVAESAVASLTSHRDVAQNFYDVGMTPVNDVLKAEVELANAQHNLIKARNDARLARVSFNVLLSKPVESPVVLEDILVYTSQFPDFDAALTKALQMRPEIKAVDIADTQADQQITLAKSKYYPEAAFSFNYLKQGDTPFVAGTRFQDSDSWQAMVQLSWTFWDWDKTKHSVGRSESVKRQLFQTRKSLEDNIRFELKKALLEIEEAEEKIPTAEKAVAQAEENLRVSEERYKAQTTTSTEVLDAQTLLSQARMNYYNALYDHNLAKARLLRAVGEY